MISFERSAPPYILFGSVAACVSAVSFFKGINGIFRIFQNQNKVFEIKYDTFREIFDACAWLGLSALTAFYFSRLKEDFLEVDNSNVLPNYLQSCKTDLEDYEVSYLKQKEDKTSLRNFCLSAIASSIAFVSIEQSDLPSSFRFKQDPRFAIAESTLQLVREFKKIINLLREDLDGKEKSYKSKLSDYKNLFENFPFAKGVKINLAQFCSTPFYFLASHPCTNYLRLKSYSLLYVEKKFALEEFENSLLNPRQLDRCQKVFDIGIDPAKILSEKAINDLKRGRKTILEKYTTW